MPFSFRDEIEELNELTRKEASGSFVQLSDGFTHYELSSPLPASSKSDEILESGSTSKLVGFGEGARFAGGGGRDIVLVHGFPSPTLFTIPPLNF